MDEILDAIDLLHKYEKMELKEVAKLFCTESGQEIPHNVVEDFLYCGLNNIDFLTSDYLNQRGFKNLYQIKNRKY